MNPRVCRNILMKYFYIFYSGLFVKDLKGFCFTYQEWWGNSQKKAKERGMENELK
jgi:hypothetical protein